MNLPQFLILFRLILAPVIILLAYFMEEKASILIVILMFAGLFSDIFDGIIARKLNLSTEKLRRQDSQTDLIFWLSMGFATWMIRRDILSDKLLFIFILIGMEALCYLISFIKFKKETCTHAMLSKFWGITLIIAFTSLLSFNHAGFPFYLTLLIGFLAHIDVILIIFLLPNWQHDIPSFYHALEIRRGKPIKRHKLFNG
ncbi:MAG: CDP-alcohol phosphatidyltransferase family protein [Pedobacter agri]